MIFDTVLWIRIRIRIRATSRIRIRNAEMRTIKNERKPVTYSIAKSAKELRLVGILLANENL